MNYVIFTLASPRQVMPGAKRGEAPLFALLRRRDRAAAWP